MVIGPASSAKANSPAIPIVPVAALLATRTLSLLESTPGLRENFSVEKIVKDYEKALTGIY